MRVLVTGGAGYVGSVLVPVLLDRGYRVRVVDCSMFGLAHVDPRAEVIAGDVLTFENFWLEDVDAVIHLAGLSNDPMAAFSPSLNYVLNAAGTAVVAHAAKEAGVARFILSSTCSVYGLNDASEIDEEHPAEPSFPYAVSKLMAERCLACLTDDGFRPIVLRKGTVVGWSPRMRFDLVTNAMIKSAFTEKVITVHNPSLWRPLIDVEDAARAYLRALDADLSVTGIFNIASENYTIGRLADEVASTLREFDIDVPLVINRREDLRSYRVSTSKAALILDFRPSISMRETVRRIVNNIMATSLSNFNDPLYHNVEQMKRVLPKDGMSWFGGALHTSDASAGTREEAMEVT